MFKHLNILLQRGSNPEKRLFNVLNLLFSLTGLSDIYSIFNKEKKILITYLYELELIRNKQFHYFFLKKNFVQCVISQKGIRSF